MSLQRLDDPVFDPVTRETMNMKVKLRKTKLFAGIVFVLSMLVSSVSACTCAHHTSLPRAEKGSCHSHSAVATKKVSDQRGPSIADGNCFCGEVAPRIAAKPDKKQFDMKAVAARSIMVDQHVVVATQKSADNFSNSFFILSSLRSSTPGRAPPRLNFV